MFQGSFRKGSGNMNSKPQSIIVRITQKRFCPYPEKARPNTTKASCWTCGFNPSLPRFSSE